MPKKVLANDKGRANSPTSVRMLRLAKRRAEALDYRLRGDSFRTIAQRMRVNASTARDYIVHSLESVAPAREVREAALELELQRLDQLQAAVAPAAAQGDHHAVEASLRVMRMRGRYLGLFQDDRRSGVTINNTNAFAGGNGEAAQNAERHGMKITFVSGGYEERADGSEWRHGVQITPPRAALPVPVAPLELKSQDVPPAPKPAPRATVAAFEPPTDVPYESAWPKRRHWME